MFVTDQSSNFNNFWIMDHFENLFIAMDSPPENAYIPEFYI